ncbi:hypothetical protein [Butyrivibrio sp. AE3004]|uniref:hypothetical protein n=1 Tax=Butyrivibrio sp. AE3004 TaxID=1506994 RepID=UPI000494D056|nr:hypothetical protein [Butyrivibrio sp. AE3004]
MAKERICSYCGGSGHDARNCPSKKANTPKDKSVWYKVDNLTDEQADKMTSGFMNLKRKIAPDAHGAYLKGDKKSLPGMIAKALGRKDD